MRDNNVRKYIIVILLMLVVLVSGTTYALFTKTVNTKGVITIKSGKRYIGIYGEDKENLGLNVTYTFTIENRGVEDASYQVTIEDIINTVGRENINYTYTNGETTKTGKLSDGIIEEENLAPGEKVTVTIRLTSDLSGDYKGKIKVTTGELINKNECVDVKSTPNPPELVGDMIPVIYNETTKNWEKADINGKWYDYEEQMWANAVTIKDQTKRAQYVSATAGTQIQIEDINTMMVWIPRYSYTLGNKYGCQLEGADDPSLKTPGAFQIKFVDKNTTEMGAGQYTGSTPTEYFTPSSFCWGDTCDDEATRKDAGNIELSGIWVAKFETTGTINEITALPNLKSLTNEIVSSYFTKIQNNMNGENGTLNYGLRGNYDTHMIKNTEWGAFAYLSQSKYGKYGNRNYESINKNVYRNNNTFVTGCSGGEPKAETNSSNCQYTYDSGLEGRGASATGTIYGIYDINGGVKEYVMGNANNWSGQNARMHSGFNGLLHEDNVMYPYGIDFPSRRYYNLYTDNMKGIKGDASFIDGTGGFNDSVYFTTDNLFNAWIVRGGTGGNYEDSNTGIFKNGLDHGAGRYNENGTRFVIITW